MNLSNKEYLALKNKDYSSDIVKSKLLMKRLIEHIDIDKSKNEYQITYFAKELMTKYEINDAKFHKN